jgi:hypothetical protein
MMFAVKTALEVPCLCVPSFKLFRHFQRRQLAPPAYACVDGNDIDGRGSLRPPKAIVQFVGNSFKDYHNVWPQLDLMTSKAACSHPQTKKSFDQSDHVGGSWRLYSNCRCRPPLLQRRPDFP